jgi:M6 family metalloprotease-like protein
MFFAATLAEFGHGSISVLGQPAAGARRLLVVLVEYSEFPPISVTHTPQYYEQLAIGDPVPPFSTDNPVNPASLREYFREVSYGRFWFELAGRIGPLSMGPLGTDPGTPIRITNIMQKVADIAPQVLTASDANGDHAVAENELSVLLIENIPGAAPGNSFQASPVQASATAGPGTVSVSVSVRPAGGGVLTPFYQLAHETSHAAVGTIDMYNAPAGLGPNKVNTGMTLMGAYSFTANDQYTVHLDIWHKLALGWAEPRVFRLKEPQTQEVWEGADGSLLLWDDSRNANEYFLIERRRPNAPGEFYDSGFAGDGIVIWRVDTQLAGGILTLAPPGLTPGNPGAWASGSQTPYLAWTSGQSTGVSVSVGDSGNGRLQVTWGEEVAHAGQGRHLMLFHGGNGTGALGELVMQGIFYGITTNGDLEWNSYKGQGEVIGDPAALQGWNPSTGDLIGRGFGQMLHVFGCGDGVIMAVHPDGDLYWYSYSGAGESDVTGTKGWDPNSGNVIGNGWQNFLHVFAFPRGPGGLTHVFAVDPSGALRWYGYTGNGEHDPSGHTGWHENSGNQVGTGWLGFRHLHGSSNVIFAIKDDGTLLWYSYEGHGEEDPDGAMGWRPNSGNPVGNGWQNMQHVFGGITDTDGIGHIVMAVDPDQNLLWYRYTGGGESDISGALGWDPRSGNQIGTNW